MSGKVIQMPVPRKSGDDAQYCLIAVKYFSVPGQLFFPTGWKVTMVSECFCI
jgi:hypothetical protein